MSETDCEVLRASLPVVMPQLAELRRKSELRSERPDITRHLRMITPYDTLFWSIFTIALEQWRDGSDADIDFL